MIKDQKCSLITMTLQVFDKTFDKEILLKSDIEKKEDPKQSEQTNKT